MVVFPGGTSALQKNHLNHFIMRLVPRWLQGRALSVSIVASVLATLACLLVGWNPDGTSRRLPDLVDRVSFANLPLAICLVAWAIVISDAESGYPPARIQLATVILFLATICPMALSVSSFRLAVAVIRQVLELF